MLKASLGQNERFNDALAPEYDRIARNANWDFLVSDLVGQTLAVRPTELPVRRTLDLGAGTGFSTLPLRRRFPDADIEAVDISSEMLSMLTLQPELHGVKRVHSSIEDYMETASEQFDVITAMACLEFVPKLPRRLSKMVALLGHQGVLGLTISPKLGREKQRVITSGLTGESTTEYLYDTGKIEARLGSLGLTVAESQTIEDVYATESGSVPYHFIAAVKG